MDQDAAGLCEMQVEFAKASYMYHDVDIEEVEAFLAAESKGVYLRSKIIPDYKATKVEVDESTEAA